MYDFNACADDPVGLMDLLESFIVEWYDLDPPKLTVYRKALQAVPMPDPLRRLYQIAERGSWLTVDPCSSLYFLSAQDHLLPFPCLKLQDERLIFLMENCGVWWGATSTEGADAPVWIGYREGTQWTWERQADSLAQFLVTHCLMEMMWGAKYQAHSGDLLSRFAAGGRRVTPLWTDGPSIGVGGPYQSSFHLVEGKVLVDEGAKCVTDSREARDWLQEFFRNDGWSPKREDDHASYGRFYDGTRVTNDRFQYGEIEEGWINRQALEYDLYLCTSSIEHSATELRRLRERARLLRQKLADYP